MIPAIVISPDTELANQLQNALSEIGQVAVLRKIDHYPAEQEMLRVIRALGPQIFFLDVTSLDEALRVASEIEKHVPGIQIMAIARDCAQHTLIELMRAGIREFVPLPGGVCELPNALLRLNAAIDRKPPAIESTDQMFAFLPSKPGVGSSTVALNASVAMANQADGKVLLMDFDLNCGMIGFLLHLDESRSVVDAAEHASHMDEELWPKLVQTVGNLDILPSGRLRADFRIEPAHIRYLIEFARRNYKVMCVDLYGLLEKYSVELMHESKRIFLVATPELPALHLAREKMEFLRSVQLEERVSLVLNRSQKHGLMGKEEIEKIIGVPVAVELPNDYRGVHQAFKQAKPVDSGSDLGKGFADLARKILARAPEATPGHRFVDYFTMSPARFSFGPSAKRPE